MGSVLGAASTTSFARIFFGVNFANTFASTRKHPAYVRVDEELQLQVVLDQAFIEATIATDSGVTLNKDSSITTICIKEEHQHHKQCQRICPSLGFFNFHFSVP